MERHKLLGAEGRCGALPGDVFQPRRVGSDLITADEAWRRLTTHNHLRMPDLGVVFNA